MKEDKVTIANLTATSGEKHFSLPPFGNLSPYLCPLKLKTTKIMTNKTETLSRGKSVSPHAGAWLWIAIAVLYSIAPLDFVPDVIVPYGWVDDILVVAISIINLVQSYLMPKNEALAKMVKRIKWIVIGFAPLVVIALAIVVLCTKIF